MEELVLGFRGSLGSISGAGKWVRHGLLAEARRLWKQDEPISESAVVAHEEIHDNCVVKIDSAEMRQPVMLILRACFPTGQLGKIPVESRHPSERSPSLFQDSR